MNWLPDDEQSFKINPNIIRNYFNKKADLVFSEDAAQYEENKLIEYLKNKKDLKVLDLGCGNGRWAGILRHKIQRYVGIDFSETFIRQAQKVYNDENIYEFKCMPAQEYAVNEKYDIIFIIGLLTYMNNEEILVMIENIKRMLHQGGMIFVRNVTIRDDKASQKFYNRRLNIFERMFGRMKYQLIRRSPENEIAFFKDFSLTERGYIQNTNYIFYIFGN
jgi:ubiquinone/menaquinone biosynthesis C-methylase UbiE